MPAPTRAPVPLGRSSQSARASRQPGESVRTAPVCRIAAREPARATNAGGAAAHDECVGHARGRRRWRMRQAAARAGCAHSSHPPAHLMRYSISPARMAWSQPHLFEQVKVEGWVKHRATGPAWRGEETHLCCPSERRCRRLWCARRTTGPTAVLDDQQARPRSTGHFPRALLSVQPAAGAPTDCGGRLASRPRHLHCARR